MSEFNKITPGIPGLIRIHHIGIAVSAGNLENKINAYRLLGFQKIHDEIIHENIHIREVLLKLESIECQIQLLEPLNDNSPIFRFLEKRGSLSEINHIAFEVFDINIAFDYLKKNGFRLVNDKPVLTPNGNRVFFIHPKSFSETSLDILIEIVQK